MKRNMSKTWTSFGLFFFFFTRNDYRLKLDFDQCHCQGTECKHAVKEQENDSLETFTVALLEY